LLAGDVDTRLSRRQQGARLAFNGGFSAR